MLVAVILRIEYNIFVMRLKSIRIKDTTMGATLWADAIGKKEKP